jgi:hypothetical protein
MKINGIVRLCIIAASFLCSVLTSFAQSDGLTFDIIEPKVNTVISKAPMTIEISFRSPIDVNSFEAYIDSKLLIKGNLRTPMPNGHFALPANYQTLRLTPGKHFFTVKLFDILGKSAQRTVGITLQNSIVAEKNPPMVRITNPKDGAVIERDEDIQITVDANDDSGIKWVLVYINDDVRAMMNTAPYIAPWNPMKENFKAGAYLITAKAIDLFENPATSKPVTVTYKPFDRTNLIPNNNIINAKPFDQIGSYSPVLPAFGRVYERFTPNDLLNQGWADGIPTGLPQMMANAGIRMSGIDNSANNPQFIAPMRLAPENINETIGGSPVMALTMAPALSALPGMINPMSVKGYSYTPMYTSLPTPTGEALPRTGITENPLVPGETLGNKTATTTSNSVLPAITTAQSISQQPGVITVPQQDSKSVKNSFTGTPASLEIINAAVNRTTDVSNPLLIAKLPDKVNTDIELPKLDNFVNSTTAVGNVPTTGNDSTVKIANSATATINRPVANAPLVDNTAAGIKNIQTAAPAITTNNPSRVTPQINAPTTGTIAEVTNTADNTPNTGTDTIKIASTSTATINRPGANAPVMENTAISKNVQTVNPGISTNNTTSRVSPQINTTVATGSVEVSNSANVTPVMKNVDVKPTTLGHGDIAPTRSNVTVNSEKTGASRSIAAEQPTVKGSTSKIAPKTNSINNSVDNVITQTSKVTPGSPTVGQQTAVGTKVTTRGDLGNPSAIATGTRNTDTSAPDVKVASGAKPSGKPSVSTTTPASVVANSSSSVNPAATANVTKNTVNSQNITTRGDLGNLSAIATGARNTDTTAPDVKVASGAKPSGKPSVSTTTPASVVANSSSSVNPAITANVTKNTVNSQNITTRGDLGNPSAIATGTRNTDTTAPDVKVASSGVKPNGKPAANTSTQSPIIVTHNTTGVNPAMPANINKDTVNSANVSTRTNTDITTSSQTTATIRNTTITTPDVKIAGTNTHVQPVPAIQGPATAIVKTGTTVKPSTTGNVTKPTVSNTTISNRGDVKNTVIASTGSRNTVAIAQPVLNNNDSQTRVMSTPSTNRKPVFIPAQGKDQTVTIDVYANYIAKKGDTLPIIAKVYNTSEKDLIKDNPGLSQKSVIAEGTNIKIKQQPAKLYVDENQIKGYPMPMLVNGAAMVPFRAVVEAKDGTVVWIADSKEVNAWLAANKAFMKMKIGDKTATINNQKVDMKNAPRIEKSRTMVEVEYLATAMNLKYEYNPTSNTYYFVSKK